MVEFAVPFPLTAEFVSLIPRQRESVDKLFTAGKMLSYSLSLDRTKLWAILIASEEAELIRLLDTLPMTPYMDYNYSELMFHNSVYLLPAMSLN